jgi:hypothetical protein
MGGDEVIGARAKPGLAKPRLRQAVSGMEERSKGPDRTGLAKANKQEWRTEIALTTNERRMKWHLQTTSQ